MINYNGLPEVSWNHLHHQPTIENPLGGDTSLLEDNEEMNTLRFFRWPLAWHKGP
jgi:hypothetical protein